MLGTYLVNAEPYLAYSQRLTTTYGLRQPERFKRETREVNLAAKSVTVGKHHFTKIGDAKEHYKAILNTYRAGERVSQDHFADVAALFELHEEFSSRSKGRKVVGFDVLKAEGGTQCFYAVYEDGAKEDFSYQKTLVYAANAQVPQ